MGDKEDILLQIQQQRDAHRRRRGDILRPSGRHTSPNRPADMLYGFQDAQSDRGMIQEPYVPDPDAPPVNPGDLMNPRRYERDANAPNADPALIKMQAGGETFEPASFWAEKYNAEHVGSDNPQKTLLAKTVQYKEAQKLPVQPEVVSAIDKAVDSAAFANEMKITGMTPELLKQALYGVSKVETSGGKINKPSRTGAAGILQVTDLTFRDLLNRNVVGPKALQTLGTSKEKLLAMTDKQRQKYLTDNDDAAAMFGLGAYMNKLNHRS